jgi:AcrR family transcriptional regulator
MDDEPTTTRHAGITRDQVVDAALALVEAGGGEALTMRKLAAELGVATTTIYWHVGNRDDLVIAVLQRQAERQAATRVRGRTPQARIVSAAANIWANALAHRNVTALANEVGATTVLALPLEVALAAELEAAGVRGRAARDLLRSLLACVAGFLVLAWRSEPQVPGELRAGSLWAGVEDGRLDPRTRDALAAPMRLADVERCFRTTLAAVAADGLARSAPSGSRRPAARA